MFNENGSTRSGGFLGCDIEEVGPRRLSEDRGAIACGAVINATEIKRFQKRRPEGKLNPFDLDTLCLEGIVNLAGLLG